MKEFNEFITKRFGMDTDPSEASPENSANRDETHLTLAEKSEEKKPDILYEDTEKRGENIKHFRMRDGSFMACVYDRPVHRKDAKTGKLIDIAHDLEEKDDCFEADAGSFKARFPKKEGKRKYVTVERDGIAVAWRYLPPSESHKKNPEAQVHPHKRASIAEIARFPSLSYESEDKKSRTEYSVTEHGVKENIILNKKPKNTTFRFALSLAGLTAVLAEDKKAISLFSANDSERNAPAFIIPKITMQDAAGAYSESAHYNLTEENGNTVLELVIDPAWLLSDERLYPVTVDPQIVMPDQYEDRFAMVSINSNNVSDYTSTTLNVGLDYTSYESIMYIKTDLPDIPSNSRITAANLQLGLANKYSEFEPSDYLISEALDAWNPSTVNWANQPGYNSNDTINVILTEDLTYDNRNAVDITDIARKWYAREKTNHGIVIHRRNNNNGNTCMDFVTFNAPGVEEEYSVFTVKYVSQDAFVDHQKHHTFDCGRAGSGSVRMIDGQLYFVHKDIAMEGKKLPLVVSHIFRPSLIGNSSVYGNGWRLSVEQTLQVINQGEVKAVYTDANGRAHYFIEDTNGKITDESGLGLTFSECSDGNNSCCLYDDKNNRMCFNSAGKLIKIIDSNGITSSITYDNSGRVITTTDGTNHTACFTYNSSGRLSKITDHNGRAISYGYDPTGRLTSVTYPPTESNSAEVLKSSFVYNNDTGRLTSIKEVGGITTTIGYDSNGRVSSIMTSGNTAVTSSGASTVSSVSGGGMIFSYGENSAVIRDTVKQTDMVYHLDTDGRELFSYEDTSTLAEDERTEVTLSSITGYNDVVDPNSRTAKRGRSVGATATVNADAAQATNLISNGKFTDTVGTLVPNGWVVEGEAQGKSGVINESYLPNTHSYRFTSDNTAGKKTLTYTIVPPENPEGNVYIASVWAKATGAMKNTSATGAQFSMRLKAQPFNSNHSPIEFHISFDPARDGEWQYAALPLGNTATYSSISVILDYSGNTGECVFSNARIIAVNGTDRYTTIPQAGTPETVKVFGTTKPVLKRVSNIDGTTGVCKIDFYDRRSDLVKTKITKNACPPTYEYFQYDTKHNLIKKKDIRDVISVYTYDEHGNMLTEKIYHEDNSNNYMRTAMEYADGYHVSKEYDPRFKIDGVEVYTEYDYTSGGLLERRTDTNGQPYDYTYDAYTDDLKKVSSQLPSGTSENLFSYHKGYLTKVGHNGFEYLFSYDALGRNDSVSVGGNELFERTFTLGAQDTVTTTYATGEKTEITTDRRGNPILKTYAVANEEPIMVSSSVYDDLGRVETDIDNLSGISYNYTYKNDGTILSVVQKKNNTVIATDSYEYEYKRLKSKTLGAVGHKYLPIYEYNPSSISFDTDTAYPDNNIVGMVLDGKFEDKVTNDALGRTSTRCLTLAGSTDGLHLLTSAYTYLNTPLSNGAVIETGLVSEILYGVYGDRYMPSLSYTYDKSGNIETVSEDGLLLAKYYYDGLNRLIREDNYESNEAYTWTYDVGGNIREKCTYCLASDGSIGTCQQHDTYTYASTGWKDQLTSYNGQSIVYDTLGNPTTYKGKTLTWSHIRRLASYGSNTFAYGADGIRYKKNNITYTLDGNRIIKETDGASRNITYYYGIDGVIGFSYNGNDFYYRKNLQGDVIAIYSACGMLAATYSYDAWGRLLYSNDYSGMGIDTINPIRYRSYYYDVDTGLYYLNSRYYDPETGRFINADDVGFIDPMTLGGINLYAYCGNNPIMGYDPEGTWDWGKAFEGALLFAIGTLTVAAVILSGGSCIPIVAAGYAILATAGTVTAVTGLSEVCEAVTETNPLENELGTTNYNNLKNASLSVISLGQVGLSIGMGIESSTSTNSTGGYTSTSPTIKSIGNPFETGSRVGKTQIGVDPYTLKTNTQIHPGKYQSALNIIKQNGMYGVIEVYSDGTVYNGNHRVHIARKLKICVDTVVVFRR